MDPVRAARHSAGTSPHWRGEQLLGNAYLIGTAVAVGLLIAGLRQTRSADSTVEGTRVPVT